MGDIVVIFFMLTDEVVGDDPFDDNIDGVKLGESTLSRFLWLPNW